MTATPTAAVGLALFAQVALIHLDVCCINPQPVHRRVGLQPDKELAQDVRNGCLGIDDHHVEQIYGVQAHHLLFYDALGLDYSWHEVLSAQKKGEAFRLLERGQRGKA
jgi:hypothetical protein